MRFCVWRKRSRQCSVSYFSASYLDELIRFTLHISTRSDSDSARHFSNVTAGSPGDPEEAMVEAGDCAQTSHKSFWPLA